LIVGITLRVAPCPHAEREDYYGFRNLTRYSMPSPPKVRRRNTDWVIGFRGYRFARPPANGCEPFGFNLRMRTILLAGRGWKEGSGNCWLIDLGRMAKAKKREAG